MHNISLTSRKQGELEFSIKPEGLKQFAVQAEMMQECGHWLSECRYNHDSLEISPASRGGGRAVIFKPSAPAGAVAGP